MRDPHVDVVYCAPIGEHAPKEPCKVEVWQANALPAYTSMLRAQSPGGSFAVPWHCLNPKSMHRTVACWAPV